MRRILASLALTVGLVTAMPESGTAQGGASCSVSATGVAFGNYDVLLSSPLDSTGSITYRCNQGQQFSIEISPGSSGSYFPRRMRLGSDLLTYNIYLEAARSTVWGNGSGGTGRLTGQVPANRTEGATVYGRILPLQDAAIGAYTDTLVVTFIF